MSRSLRRAGEEPAGTVTARGTRITISSTPTGFWQTWENGGEQTRYRVDYVVGSGNHASGYIVNLGGHLFQSPVAFYKSRQSYDLAPGYETTPDPDFTRPIGEECLLCHSGKALYVPGTLNSYRSPVFAAEGITCERCHGPVERHLADPRAGTIVNPAKLEPAARDSICEQCHLFGATRVPNPGKTLADFVPGQRLEDTFTIYHDVVPAGSAAGNFKVISHVEQLALSACARNSNGRLWCGTCHDPHDKPADPVAYYRARCLSCHGQSFPTSHPPQDSNCLECHMPRRQAKDGGHSAFTDHRIQRRPETLPNAPSDVGIAPWRPSPPEFKERNLGIAYIDVGMQRHLSSFVIEGYRILTSVQQKYTDDSSFFQWVGEALLLGKQTEEAKFALGRALQLEPDSATAEASYAAPFMMEGDDAEATKHLERAVTLDPLYLPAASTLIQLYQKEGGMKKASELSARVAEALKQQPAPVERLSIASPNASEKNAGETYKNIDVLKTIPSDQLIPSMRFISASLGVACSYCHVAGHFDKDDKKPKRIARDMMRMMFEIDNESFAGRREVTCYSCHRGHPHPEGVPNFSELANRASLSSLQGGTPLPPALPTIKQLIDHFQTALGGISAIQQITSRIAKGTIRVGPETGTLEVFTQRPARQLMVIRLPKGESITSLNGNAGWNAFPGRPTRPMDLQELAIARMDADLQFALHLTDVFPDLHVEYPEMIAGRPAFVLVGVHDPQLTVKLYFDEGSGLLVRVIRLVNTPLGRNPYQVDYEDYRAVDGVRIPFHETLFSAGQLTDIRLGDVRNNAPIDPTAFAKSPNSDPQ